MDFKAFSGEEFSPITWINDAFDPGRVDSTSDGHEESLASNLVLKLQLFVQEVNNSLQDEAENFSTGLKRVMRDVEFVGTDLNQLTSQLSTLEDQLTQMEKKTATDFITKLMALDLAKKRMQETLDLLKDAQKADQQLTIPSLEPGVPRILVGGDQRNDSEDVFARSETMSRSRSSTPSHESASQMSYDGI